MKYSIILPTLNSISYLPSCVETIISQNYDDYELIISNNCSTDETKDYLEKLQDSHIKIVQPEKTLSLGEHWNFAISHASGEWIYGIGSDDGVLPYFFKLLDKLTNIADKNNLKIIKSNRVYYFWEGLQQIYGPNYINFSAKPNIKILSTKKIIYDVLYSNPQLFFDIPQMYTTAVFHKSILQKCKNNDTGKIIQEDRAHDISLGVIGCMYEDKYLYTDIPIGWVGSSPNSVGYKITKSNNELNINDIYNHINNNLDNYYDHYKYTIVTIKSMNLILASNIINFESYNHRNLSVPDEFKFDKDDNVIKLFSATYFDILKDNNEENKNIRLFFLWDMLKHKGILKNTFMKHISNKILQKKQENIKNNILFSLLKKIKSKLTRLFYDYISINISQTYEDKNRFESMLEVNKFIFESRRINKMINNLRLK